MHFVPGKEKIYITPCFSLKASFSLKPCNLKAEIESIPLHSGGFRDGGSHNSMLSL